jgi:hypothetical protein
MSYPVKQRAEYTFKFNQNLGRHGWLRLTPAYSVKLVERLLGSVDQDGIILDPFSGTATTGLVAAERGQKAFAFDINPFLVWLGNAKCQNYSEDCLREIRQQVQAGMLDYKTAINRENWTPQIFKIERWWTADTLQAIAALRTILVHHFGEPAHNASSLIWIAFCRLIIETSSAAFNHVSMSFANQANPWDSTGILGLFNLILETILQTASHPIPGFAQIQETDSRQIAGLNDMKFRTIITSPPYPNRMSYIRELRPYMYWTKFLKTAKEAGEIDWKAIGGTWGIATSRLLRWQMEETNLPASVFSTVEQIKTSEGKNAELMGLYVLKYFHDMHLHLASLQSRLENQAKLYYVVGNSTFFGKSVDTAALLAESLQMLGYQQVHSEIIRKRNCNKALYEYCVSATWSSG